MQNINKNNTAKNNKKAPKRSSEGELQEGVSTRSSGKASNAPTVDTDDASSVRSCASSLNDWQMATGKIPAVILTKVSQAVSLSPLYAEEEEMGNLPPPGRNNSQPTTSADGSPADPNNAARPTYNELFPRGEEDEAPVPVIPEARGPGGGETTGEYCLKQAREEERKIRAEIERLQKILDVQEKPEKTKTYMEFVEEVRKKEAEYRRPIPDLEAPANEQAIVLYKIAVKSNNMQGTLAKGTKEAAAQMCAAATALAIRAQNPADVPIDEQLRDLRTEIAKLRHQNKTANLLLEKYKRGKQWEKGSSVWRGMGFLGTKLGNFTTIRGWGNPRVLRKGTATTPKAKEEERKESK